MCLSVCLVYSRKPSVGYAKSTKVMMASQYDDMCRSVLLANVRVIGLIKRNPLKYSQFEDMSMGFIRCVQSKHLSVVTSTFWVTLLVDQLCLPSGRAPTHTDRRSHLKPIKYIRCMQLA